MQTNQNQNVSIFSEPIDQKTWPFSPNNGIDAVLIQETNATTIEDLPKKDSFCIDGNLTEQRYRELLQERVIPSLNHMIIKLDNQMNGSSIHSTPNLRTFLTHFGIAIGRNMRISWIFRFPDLAPDCFFLGYIK
ncbi:hypothetical protein Trydic_g11463 [Trypoxylus dichotomus]